VWDEKCYKRKINVIWWEKGLKKGSYGCGDEEFDGEEKNEKIIDEKSNKINIYV
jgi:hypothetical protein